MPAIERSFWVAGGMVAFSLVLGEGPAFSRGAFVQKIVVLERGVYHAEAAGLSNAEKLTRPVYQVRSSRLLSSTTLIPARQWVRFGARYMIVGTPIGAPVSLRMITRFPEAGVVDPETRVRTFYHEYTVTEALGSVSYRDYHFDHRWEIVPGRWTLEFWQGERKLGEQEFCVVEDPSKAQNRSEDACVKNQGG
jgi:hypothetical protein